MALEVLVIGASLNPHSFSQVLAREVCEELERLGAAPQFVDLREHDLPLCDGGNEAVAAPELADAIAAADAVVLAIPVYNYSASAAAKNLIELTGNAWQDKVVGFACAAGGMISYMSPLSLANALMLDFQCIIVPKILYTTRHDYEHQQLTAERARQRLHNFATQMLRIGTAIKTSLDVPTE